jgi:hypothetical protein
MDAVSNSTILLPQATGRYAEKARHSDAADLHHR